MEATTPIPYIRFTDEPRKQYLVFSPWWIARRQWMLYPIDTQYPDDIVAMPNGY